MSSRYIPDVDLISTALRKGGPLSKTIMMTWKEKLEFDLDSAKAVAGDLTEAKGHAAVGAEVKEATRALNELQIP